MSDDFFALKQDLETQYARYQKDQRSSTAPPTPASNPEEPSALQSQLVNKFEFILQRSSECTLLSILDRLEKHKATVEILEVFSLILMY